MSRAQNIPSISTPTVPPIDPLAPALNSVQPTRPFYPPINSPAGTGSPAAGTNPADSTNPPPLGTTTPSLPTSTTSSKYEEFQSTCRLNEYDQVAFYPEMIKEKRIQLIQQKINSEPQSVKLKLRLLKEYIAQKKSTEFERVLKELKAGKSTESEMKIASGAVAFAKKERKKAKELLNSVLSTDPKNTIALLWLAEVFYEEGNYFEVTAIYYDLKKNSSEDFQENLCIANTLDAHYAEAEPFCLKGSQAKQSPLFDTYLGVAAREKQNLREAEKFFKASLNIKPTEMAYSCLGELYYLEKKFAAAQENFSLASQIVPESARAHLGLAWSYFLTKNRVKALESFSRACKIDKKNALQIRKAVKILLEEKSDLVPTYAAQIQRCSDI